MAARASAISATAAADMGKALYRSFDGLLTKNLDTKPVAAAHGLVERAVHAVNPSLTPYLFGSTAVYGYHEPGTDADFVVLNPADVLDGKAADPSSEVAKGVQVELLTKLMHALRHAGEQPCAAGGAACRSVWQAELVSRTRVPVLRVKGGATTEDGVSSSGSDGVGGVDFDVTANRRNGVRNSALLRGYFAQAPESRWLGIAVKQWSKRSGLNMGVEGGCLTSYGFNLMVAYYLLRRGVVQYVSPESCDVAHLEPMPSYMPLTAPVNEGGALGEMMLDFLGYYLHEFNPDTEVISLSRGVDKTSKEDLQWTKRAEDMARISGEKTNYRWCIEDPYEQNLNVGRFITPFKLMLLRKHLERARDTHMLLTAAPPSSQPQKKKTLPTKPGKGGSAQQR